MAFSENAKRQLYFHSAGYCGNPECNCSLFQFYESGSITNFGEIAHIIGKKEDGPRGANEMDLSDRDIAENAILLCPTCHTIIDKNEDEYPVELLLEWKKNHLERVKSCFVTPVYKTRYELRRVIRKLLIQNKQVFDQYGPHSSYKDNLITDIDIVWRKRSLEVIVPNNRKILRLLDANEHLLNEDELNVLEQFREHAAEFEFNLISEEPNPYAPLFPQEINNILLDEEE